MAARRESGASDDADHLPATDPLTRLNQIARGVVEGSLHPNSIDAAVAEEQSIAVGGVEERFGHDAGVRSTNRCAAPGGKVSAVVQFPDFAQWVEPHPERGTHSPRHRMEKPVTARSSSSGHDRAALSRRSGRSRASLSFAFHHLSLRLGYQAQPAAATAQQQQRVEIALALAQPPVQAAGTMPARSEDADHLSQRHPLTNAERADHRLVRCAD